MFVYFVGLLLSVTISLVIEKIVGFNSKKSLKMFISMIPLTVISAVRYDVGWDYLSIYTTGFYMVGEYGVKWFTEGLFRLIIQILFALFQDPISLFVLFSILISLFFSMCYSYYGRTKNVFVYIILFVITRYYFCSLNIMRQALAMLIILYALKYIAEKDFKKYILYIALAGGFHYTSYIFIPLYFLLGRNFKTKKNLALSLLMIPIVLTGLLIFVSNTKYSNYFVSMFGNDGSIVISELLISSVIVATGFYLYKKVKINDTILCLFNMELMAFCLSLISFLLPVGDRIIWIFSIVNLFLIPELLRLIEKRKIRLFMSVVIYAVLLLVFFMQTVYGDSYSVLPYYTIWQQ